VLDLIDPVWTVRPDQFLDESGILTGRELVDHLAEEAQHCVWCDINRRYLVGRLEHT